jgi:hypothetical protein
MQKTQHILWVGLVISSIFTTNNILAAIPMGYYDSVNTSNAAALRDSLHEIIDDHQRFPYTSSATDTWDILESADEDPNNPSKIIGIYKNESYTKAGGVTVIIIVNTLGQSHMGFRMMALATIPTLMHIICFYLIVVIIPVVAINLMQSVMSGVLKKSRHQTVIEAVT